MGQLSRSLHIPKKWGYETVLVNNESYCGKILTVIPNGMTSSVHYHRCKKETFCVRRGLLYLEIWRRRTPEPELALETSMDIDQFVVDKVLELDSDMSLTVERGVPHRFWVTRELAEFIEVSTPDTSSDSYRLIESGPLSGATDAGVQASVPFDKWY